MPWAGSLSNKRVGVATLWKHFITMKLSTNETWIYLPIKISYIHILSTCTDASLPPAGHAFLSRLHVDIAALVFPTFQLLVRLILAASKQDDWLVLFILTEWNWITKNIARTLYHRSNQMRFLLDIKMNKISNGRYGEGRQHRTTKTVGILCRALYK